MFFGSSEGGSVSPPEVGPQVVNVVTGVGAREEPDPMFTRDLFWSLYDGDPHAVERYWVPAVFSNNFGEGGADIDPSVFGGHLALNALHRAAVEDPRIDIEGLREIVDRPRIEMADGAEIRQYFRHGDEMYEGTRHLPFRFDDLWTAAILRRPDEIDQTAASTQNAPALRLGVYETEDRSSAMLVGPSMEHFNNTSYRLRGIDPHDPNRESYPNRGMIYEQGTGKEDGATFLGALGDRRFRAAPRSTGLLSSPDIPLLFENEKRRLRNEESVGARTVMTVYEHDIIEHVGIIGTPLAFVDEIADVSSLIGSSEDQGVIDAAANAFDMLLTYQSHFLLLDAIGEQSADVKHYRRFLVDNMEYRVGQINTLVRENFGPHAAEAHPLTIDIIDQLSSARALQTLPVVRSSDSESVTSDDRASL